LQTFSDSQASQLYGILMIPKRICTYEMYRWGEFLAGILSFRDRGGAKCDNDEATGSGGKRLREGS
jgi:hypothetical protein